MTQFSIDVGIIGAGLAGLTSGRQLQQLGFKVLLLDKSRGIGGRVATRRVNSKRLGSPEIVVDHGLPFWMIQGEKTQFLSDDLSEDKVIKPWQDFPSVYIADDGINAIPKFLAKGLEIRRNFLVTRLTSTAETWLIEGQEAETVAAKAVILAIPAPQAVMLLQASNLTHFLPELTSVEYDPCLTVMAGYGDSLPSIPKPLPADFAWIGLDSSKRLASSSPVFVLHSSPDFAEKYLESENLDLAKQELLDRLAWTSPEWSQIHRWRYALPRRGLAVSCLGSIDPLPLVCCGDWCQDGRQSAREYSLESALNSGEAAAIKIRQFLTL